MLDELLRDLCAEVGIANATEVVKRRMIEIKGFECSFELPDNDPGSLYLLFNYGIATAGRTLRLFTSMLEANLTVYAKDQAQLGIDSETGVVLLIVRVAIAGSVDAHWLSETLDHYAEHGVYWRDNIFRADDEMFESIAAGDYAWIRV
jgi:hypothetical protein